MARSMLGGNQTILSMVCLSKVQTLWDFCSIYERKEDKALVIDQ
jgi:hypothetical protein